MARLFTFEARAASTIRDNILRTFQNGLSRLGVPNPNVSRGTDVYVFAQAIGNELTVVEANAIVRADAQMPDTAMERDLLRIANIYGLSLQPAAPASGTVVFKTTAPTNVATGAELIDDSGLRYGVMVGGLMSDGDLIPIVGIDTGMNTNHAQGDVLRWTSTPPFAEESVTVGPGGLTDGHDMEEFEGLRERLLAKLRTPPRSGNWEHVAEIAESSSSAVEKAFVYSALQGAGTVHVAVTAAPSVDIRLRDVNATTMLSQVEPYVRGQLPVHVHSVITTVANVPCDVTFLLAIPDAPTASPPGPGGGWLDGTPWPDRGVTGQGCRVTAVTSSQIITVDAARAPFAGVSRVAWLSTSDWTVRVARVTTVSGTSGAYQITLDMPFTGIAAGNFIWPACENGQTYADMVLTSFARMGPGEKTGNISDLIRGFRHPPPRVSWPYSLSTQMLRDITGMTAEIDTAQFLWRSDGTTSLSGTSGSLSPPVPLTLDGMPSIYVPNRIGFYQL